MTRTDYSGAAYGVNKFGQTVGYTQKEDQNHNLISVAFIYSPDFGGSISDLNTYPLDGGSTPASLGWTLTSAVSINDSGVMVGHVSISGQSREWIIYPKCQDQKSRTGFQPVCTGMARFHPRPSRSAPGRGQGWVGVRSGVGQE